MCKEAALTDEDSVIFAISLSYSLLNEANLIYPLFVMVHDQSLRGNAVKKTDDVAAEMRGRSFPGYLLFIKGLFHTSDH